MVEGGRVQFASGRSASSCFCSGHTHPSKIFHSLPLSRHILDFDKPPPSAKGKAFPPQLQNPTDPRSNQPTATGCNAELCLYLLLIMAWGLGFGLQKRSVKAAFAFICAFLVFPAFSSTNGAFGRRKKGLDGPQKSWAICDWAFGKEKNRVGTLHIDTGLHCHLCFLCFFFFLFLFFLFSHLPNRAGPGHSSLLLSSLGGGASLSLRVWRRGVKLGSRLWAESWLWAGTRKEKKIEDTPLDCY